MTNTHEKRLLELGFPKSVVQETVNAVERGLFDIEPSADLVQRTLERCRDRLLKVATKDTKKYAESEPFDELLVDLMGKLGAAQKADAQLVGALEAFPSSTVSEFRAELDQLDRLERLPVDCLALAREKKRPAMIVDNHNVINPSWWNDDSGFRAMRAAFRLVNDIARRSGAPPIAVLMVLRPKVSNYSRNELVAFSELVNSATSDIWVMPYEKAGQYKTEDVIVLGKRRVLQLRGEFTRPGDAFHAFHEVNNESMAFTVRCNIEEATHRAVYVRNFGKISNWQGAKELLEHVIKRSPLQSVK